MKRGVLITLWALALTVLAPSLSHSAPLVLSKDADGTVQPAALSFALRSNPATDGTALLIPDGSKLVSEQLAWNVGDHGVGLFAGPVRITTPDGRVVLRAFLHGTIGITTKREDGKEARLPGHLEGMLGPLPSGPTPTDATSAVVQPLIEVNFSADDVTAGGNTPGAYHAHLDGLIAPPPPPPPPPGQVFIAPDRLLYVPADPITAIITNRSAHDIQANDGRSYCTIVQLQRMVNDQWQPVAPCLVKPAIVPVVIKAGQAYKVMLPPAGTTAPGRDPGVYRLAITYQDVPPAGGTAPDPTTAFSGPFKIGEPTTGFVSVTPSKLEYRVDEPIIAAVKNGLTVPVQGIAFYSYCTILQLQRQDASGWNTVKGCMLTGGPTMNIAPSDSVRVALPSDPNSSPVKDPGVYRLAFKYVTLDANGSRTDAMISYSPSFRVVAPPPPTGAVTVASEKPEYAVTEQVVALIRNGLTVPIAVPDMRSFCSIVEVQRQTASGWQMTQGCPLDRMPINTIIKPGEGVRVPLPNPLSATFQWEPGVYRFAITFSPVDTNGVPTKATMMVVSDPFRVGGVPPPTGRVLLAPTKTSYAPHELIAGVITNAMNAPIGLKDGQSFCSVIQLQKGSNTTAWQTVYLCPNVPGHTIAIPPAGVLKVGLPEMAVPEFTYDPGTYRLLIKYVVLSPDGTTPPAEVTVTSDPFVVQGTPPPPSGKVLITSDKLQYGTNEPIIATVANQTDHDIVAWDHQSDCTFVQLQRPTSAGDWTTVELCPLASPSMPVVVKAGEVKSVPLPGIPDAAGNLGHQAGTYRLALTFQFKGPDGNPAGDMITTTSPTFVVGTPPPGASLKVTSDKRAYAVTDPITATITNGPVRVRVMDEQSQCTLVQLQTFDGTHWLLVDQCIAFRPPMPVVLNPNEVRTFTLARNTPWQAGLYRLAVPYAASDSAGNATGPEQVAISDTFTVGTPVPTGDVAVAPDKVTYAPTDRIRAIIKNGSAHDVGVSDQKSFCTVVTLLRQAPDSSAGWTPVAPCPIVGPAVRWLPIKGGTSITVPLPPETQAPAFDPGTYRLAVTWVFLDAAGLPTGTPTTVMSAPFTVATPYGIGIFSNVDPITEAPYTPR